MLTKDLQISFLKIISLNNLNERVFNNGISVLCCYDPEGVILKFVRGELSLIFTSRQITTTISAKKCFYAHSLSRGTGKIFALFKKCNLTYWMLIKHFKSIIELLN